MGKCAGKKLSVYHCYGYILILYYFRFQQQPACKIHSDTASWDTTNAIWFHTIYTHTHIYIYIYIYMTIWITTEHDCLHHSNNITSLWPAECHSIHCKTRYACPHHNQTTQKINLVCLKYTLSQSGSHSSLTQTRRTPINIKQHSKMHLVCLKTRHALSWPVSAQLVNKGQENSH